MICCTKSQFGINFRFGTVIFGIGRGILGLADYGKILFGGKLRLVVGAFVCGTKLIILIYKLIIAFTFAGVNEKEDTEHGYNQGAAAYICAVFKTGSMINKGDFVCALFRIDRHKAGVNPLYGGFNAVYICSPALVIGYGEEDKIVFVKINFGVETVGVTVELKG